MKSKATSPKSPWRNGGKLACFKNEVQGLERWLSALVPSTQIRYLTSACKFSSGVKMPPSGLNKHLHSCAQHITNLLKKK